MTTERLMQGAGRYTFIQNQTMKHTFTLLMIVMATVISAQPWQTPTFVINFEDTAVLNHYYYKDTVLDPQGLWQIGHPAKAIFDSADASDSAIVTLLDSMVTAGSQASFVIHMSSTNEFMGDIMTFRHKFDFDSAHSGGYIEYSIDG